MPSSAANARFEAALPGVARGAEFICVLKADPPLRISDVKELRDFALKLQVELNTSGRLASFYSSATLDFGGNASSAPVSSDETAALIMWTTRDELDSRDASASAREGRRIVDRLARGLPSISSYGVVTVSDIATSALVDTTRILKECFVVVVPAALLLLWYAIGCLRLLLIPTASLLVAACTSFGAVYVWSFAGPIHASTPILMLCTLVFTTMDYSLFLLARFQDELGTSAMRAASEGRQPTAAQQVERALCVTAQTVAQGLLASAALLFLALLSLILFPLNMLSCFGIGASISVLVAALCNLTLGPAIIASFPKFFAAGAVVRVGLDGKPSEPVRHSALWSWVVTVATTWPANAIVILAVLAFGVAAASSALRLQSSNNLEGFVSRGTDDFEAIAELQDVFGLGMVASYKVLLQPHEGTTVLSESFWEGSQQLVEAIQSELPGVARSALVFPSSAFGMLVPWSAVQRCIEPGGTSLVTTDAVCRNQSALLDRFSNADRTAVWGSFWASFDPYSEQGIDFVRDSRHLAARLSQRTHVDVTIAGGGADAADVVTRVRSLFPMMAFIMLAIVLVACAIIFWSVWILVWQGIAVATTLLFAYGLSVLVYQDDVLGQLHIPSFSGRLGTMPWIAPVMAFPFVAGMCADYVFLLSKVTELRDQGLEPLDAIRRGVACTGGVVSTAGIIAAGTFASLLFSRVLFLNCGAFCIVVALLFDTLFVRALVAPAAMSLACRWQWWPPQPHSSRKHLKEQALPSARNGAKQESGAPSAPPRSRVWPVPEDADVLRCMVKEATAKVLRWIDEVDAGDWGEAVAGSKEGGLIYSHASESMASRTFLAFLDVPEADATLEELMHILSPPQVCEYLSNSSTRTSVETLSELGPQLTISGTTSTRTTFGVTVERCSQDVYRAFEPVEGDGGSKSFVSVSLGTTGAFLTEALQHVSPALAQRLAEHALEAFSADTVFIFNHLSARVIQRPASGMRRLTYIVQVDPNLPGYIPRWGIEFSQRLMIQEVLAGILQALQALQPFLRAGHGGAERRRGLALQ